MFGCHRELRVPIVVLEHVADTARDEREHGVDESLPRRLHHVVELEGGCEGVADEGPVPVRVEVGAENVHALLLDGEVFLLVCAGAAGHAEERFFGKLVQVVGEEVAVGDGVVTEPHHSTTGDRREGGVTEGIHLEHKAHIGRNGEALPRGEGEELGVVEDTIQVLRPLRVHVAIEYDPVAPFHFPADVVQNVPQNLGEHAVRPLERGLVKRTVQFGLGESLGVDDVRLSLHAVD